MAASSTGKGPLSARDRWVLGGWALMVLVMAGVTVMAGRNAEGWGDLVAVLGLMFLAVSLAVLVVVGLVARYLVASESARTLVVALGPPLLLFVALLVTRGAG